MAIILESIVVSAFRAALFIVCRRSLLRSLEHDLNTDADVDAADDTELDALPPPSTTPKETRFPFQRPHPLHSTFARGCFALIFCESCTLFLLLLLQGIDVRDPIARLLNFRLSLLLLLTSILVLAPLSLSLSLALHPSAPTLTPARFALALVPVFLLLLLLSYIPLPVSLASFDLATTLLTRLLVLGTVILGMLSGFGAARTMAESFPLLSRTESPPTDAEISTAEASLARVRADLAARQSDAAASSFQSPTSGQSWTRLLPTLRQSDAALELNGLTALDRDLSHSLARKQRVRAAVRAARTFRGRLLSVANQVFALYCAYRILASALHLFLPSTYAPARPSPDLNAVPNQDLPVRLLAALLALLPDDRQPSPARVAALARQLSLAAVGALILASLRLVRASVRCALALVRPKARGEGTVASAGGARRLGTSVLVLVLAQLMGIYLLATVVQLRATFPPPPHGIGAAGNVFEAVPPLEVFGPTFDACVLLSAAGSAFARWAGSKVTG